MASSNSMRNKEQLLPNRRKSLKNQKKHKLKARKKLLKKRKRKLQFKKREIKIMITNIKIDREPIEEEANIKQEGSPIIRINIGITEFLTTEMKKESKRKEKARIKNLTL